MHMLYKLLHVVLLKLFFQKTEESSFQVKWYKTPASFTSLRKFYSSSVWWEGLVWLLQNSFSANKANLEDLTEEILASSPA